MDPWADVETRLKRVRARYSTLRKYALSQPLGRIAMGKVVSGSGGTYEFDLYESGLEADPTLRVTVTQGRIEQGQSIPEGSPWYVVQTLGGQWMMQFPVWLPAKAQAQP